MRTLVLSDLHLGCGPDPGIAAGAGSLAPLLTSLSDAPLRVVLNGDTFDFPAQGGEGEVAYALARDPTNVGVLAALGRVLERGGELIFRGGHHDEELARAAVQAHVLAGLQVPDRLARRVRFAPRGSTTRCEIGGRVALVRHALAEVAPGPDDPAAHAFINSLRRQFGVGLADLLRAHPPEAALAGLAVNPTAARHVLAELPAASHLLRALRATAVFTRAELRERESTLLLAAIDRDIVLGADAHDGSLLRARLKLLRTSVGAAAPGGGHPRDASADEWAAATARARRDGASAVLGGHTHAAAWRAQDGLVACDTGAWTWLAQVPAPEGGDAAWEAYLERWQRSPRIDAGLSGLPPLRLCLTAALLSPRPRGRGATLALIEWRAGELVRLREQSLT